MNRLAEQMKALADETRLKILKLVLTRELCVCEIVQIMRLSQPTISNHLAKLKNAGLVTERRAGQWVYYASSPRQIAAVAEALREYAGASIDGIPWMGAEAARFAAREHFLTERAGCCGPRPKGVEMVRERV